ncbi:MAG: hypothetical protein KF770_02560 [Anaerolineae bacterium]|nr:hypothetical protein [Anaerolineae bacterium]
MFKLILGTARQSSVPISGEEMAPSSVILRNEKRENDSRYLAASYNTDGDLIIEGQDLGENVQSFFGCIEYEWTWTIRATNLPSLKQALGNSDNVLESLKTRFSNENAAGLITFLTDNKIVFESWSRIGD